MCCLVATGREAIFLVLTPIKSAQGGWEWREGGRIIWTDRNVWEDGKTDRNWMKGADDGQRERRRDVLWNGVGLA